MVSSSLKISMLTAVAVLAATTAQGADYAPPPPPQIMQPPPQEFAENWYLRGFVGVGMTSKFKLDFLGTPHIRPTSSSIEFQLRHDLRRRRRRLRVEQLAALRRHR